MSGWIYAAVVVSLVSAGVGLAASGMVARRVFMRSNVTPPRDRRPVVMWLLVVLAAMSLAQVLEQSRVLVYRLAYDGVIDRSWFAWLYEADHLVATGKVLSAIASAVAAVVIFGLFCRHPEPRIQLWCALALVWVLAAYVALSLALETVM